MLSIFPEILFLSPFAPLLIRLGLAALFAYTAWAHVQQIDLIARVLAVLEATAAIALLLGVWTQPAAILGAIIAVVWLAQPAVRAAAVSSVLLALVMCVSLLLTGAGAFAFDLPL